MSLDALIKTVSQIAPVLGGALAGPAGAIIGSAIASKFGGTTDNSEDLLAKIQADPLAQQKLIEVQLEIERIKMTKESNQLNHDSQVQEIEFKDRDSARNREIKLAESGMRDWTTSILAYLILILLAGMMILLFFKPVPDDNQVMMASTISALAGMVSAAIAYYFGSMSKKENGKDNKG